MMERTHGASSAPEVGDEVQQVARLDFGATLAAEETEAMTLVRTTVPVLVLGGPMQFMITSLSFGIVACDQIH